MGRIVRLLKKSPRVWWMAVQALCLSAWYRWHILHRPFSELSDRIGSFQKETEIEPCDAKTLSYIRDVQYAVMGVCNHTPWESRCLVQALTAKKILNRHGYACTLYMGVGKDQNNQMIAHAWLRCGNRFVTGGNGFLHYAVTGTYADLT